MEHEALSGNGETAWKLALFYGLVPPMDQEKYKYWATISAEDGDPTGEYGLGVILEVFGAKADRPRAIFWLRKALATGRCQYCAGLLKELGEGSKPQ